VAERFVARSAVFIALRNTDGAVLLHRRANTGFMDGRYDLPSGHVEKNEPVLRTAVRELKEEAGIAVDESDLRLWHVNQFAANDQYYYNFFFVVEAWKGVPAIMEPEKCDDMQFFALDSLPKLTAGSHVALQQLDKGHVTFGYIDQAVFDEISA
jgi:8-oxo-dGTP diphosphatase